MMAVEIRQADAISDQGGFSALRWRALSQKTGPLTFSETWRPCFLLWCATGGARWA
jgi:hypothetical protein